MKKTVTLLLFTLMMATLASCAKPNIPNNDNPAESSIEESSNSNETNQSNSITDISSSNTDTDTNTDTNPPDTQVTIDKNYMLGIIDKIYRAADGSVYKGYYLSDQRDEMIKQGKISEKNSARYFGTTLEFDIAVYSESNMEAVAYSMCLLKVKSGANIEQIKTAIKNNADPNKWECVTAESVVVESNGEYILLIMADVSETTALKNAFMSLNLE